MTDVEVEATLEGTICDAVVTALEENLVRVRLNDETNGVVPRNDLRTRASETPEVAVGDTFRVLVEQETGEPQEHFASHDKARRKEALATIVARSVTRPFGVVAACVAARLWRDGRRRKGAAVTLTSARVFLMRSEPARSTRFSLECKTWAVLEHTRTRACRCAGVPWAAGALPAATRVTRQNCEVPRVL